MIRKNVEVVPYDSRWPKLYEAEAALLEGAAALNFCEVHHVGSTSIPGLAAKPKIDIILAVKDVQKAQAQLEKVGYEYRGEFNIPMRYFFRKRHGVNVNLHLYKKGHAEIELNLTFRDYLREHTEMRQAYQDLKYEILEDEAAHIKKTEGGFVNYTLHKADFINSVLEAAGFTRYRILKCTTETEWKAVKHYRDTYFFDSQGVKDPYEWSFDHKDHAHLVFYQGAEIIGYVHLQFWPDHRAAIRIIVIDENKRKQGAGAVFLKLCGEWLKSQGIKSVHAESRQSSLSFYEKNGYAEMPFNDPDGYESDEEDIPVGKSI